MTTERRFVAAIAGLLMVAFLLTACSPGGGAASSTEATVSAVRAMTQYADVGTAGTDGTYNPSGFTADDGTVIEFGTFRTDTDGSIVEADITMRLPAGQVLAFTMVPSSGSGNPAVTVGDDPVPPGDVPVAMTASEERAFMLFLISFEELQDDIRETIEEAAELIEDSARAEGPNHIDHRGVTGTVYLRLEEWDDGRPEYEVVGWDVAFSDLRLEDSFAFGVSGSHSFSERGEREISVMKDVRISRYSEDGDLVLTDILIDGTVTEDEVWDEDTFGFEGTVSGSFSVGSASSDILFHGVINAMEERYLRFPEYSLTINGKDCAIGRELKPFRN